MKLRIFALMLFLAACPAFAQDSSSPRAQLQRYVAELQKDPDDQALRERIIKVALTLDPKPATPEEAKRFLARGLAAAEEAKEPKDFKDAAAEFEQASLAAPWLGEPYRYLGIVLDKAGDYAAATRNLKLYLLSEPDEAQADKAKELIYKIEFRQEKADKEKARIEAERAEAARRQEQMRSETARRQEEMRSMIQGLNGTWDCEQRCVSASVTLDGNTFNLTADTGKPDKGSVMNHAGFPAVQDNHAVWMFEGMLNGFSIDGTVRTPPIYSGIGSDCTLPSDTHSFSGTISEDGKSITIKTEVTVYAVQGHFTLIGSGCTEVRSDHNEPMLIRLSRTSAPLPKEGVVGTPASEEIASQTKSFRGAYGFKLALVGGMFNPGTLNVSPTKIEFEYDMGGTVLFDCARFAEAHVKASSIYDIKIEEAGKWRFNAESPSVATNALEAIRSVCNR